MPRNRHDRTGVYLILASIAGALTLAVVGGGFWLAFRHPNESEAAKQARERREQDRAYYDSLGPYDPVKAEEARAKQEAENNEYLTNEANKREQGRLKVQEIQRGFGKKNP